MRYLNSRWVNSLNLMSSWEKKRIILCFLVSQSSPSLFSIWLLSLFSFSSTVFLFCWFNRKTRSMLQRFKLSRWSVKLFLDKGWIPGIRKGGS